MKNMYIIFAFLAMVCLAPAVAQEKLTGFSDMKLYLDPGHSKTGNQGYGGYSEAEKTLAVAHALVEYLLRFTDMQEENIILSRYTDEDEEISFSSKADECATLGAHLYYSIHSDASSSNATINSTLFLYGGRREVTGGAVYEKLPEGGKQYGEILNDDLSSVMRANNGSGYLSVSSRGVQADLNFYASSSMTPYLGVHSNTNNRTASLLSEAGFHTTAQQNMQFVNVEYKKLQAYAAYQSLVKYLSEKHLDGRIEPVQAGIVTGFVYDEETNRPVNGAGITLTEDATVKEYTTDTYESLPNKYNFRPEEFGNGFYWVEGFTPGATVTVEVHADGFESQQQIVEIPLTAGAKTSDGLGVLDIRMANQTSPTVKAEIDNPNAAPFTKPVVLRFSRKMDRQSVEEALSISPEGQIILNWSDDFTLRINIRDLNVATRYELTIDGSVAKNTLTGQYLDGGNGAGSNYLLVFTTNNVKFSDYLEPDQDENVVALDHYIFEQQENTLEAPWLNEDNIKRAIHRDGKLYVLTKGSDPKIFIVDPATLELIREMDLTGIVATGCLDPLSDIGFTADGFLLACNRSTVQFSTEVENGNVFRVYIWKNDDVAPTVFYQVNRTSVDAAKGNWINGTLGETMAVSGSSTETRIYTPARSGVSFRLACHIKRENNSAVEARFMMESGASGGAGGNNFSTHWGDDFLLTKSPLGDEHIIVTSNDIVPREYNFNWDLGNRSNLTLVSDFAEKDGYEIFKTNGANYFRYAKRTYMAAPVAAEGRTQAGVVLFDVTDGLKNAIKISEKLPENGIGVDAAPYMMAYGTVDNYHINLSLLAENQGFATFKTALENWFEIYTVTVTNGNGSGKYAEGSLVQIIAEEQFGDRMFVKWNITPEVVFETGNETTTIASFYMPANDVVVIAEYEPEKFNVTFNLNYEGAPAPTVVPVFDGNPVEQPADPTREGFDFGGWFREADCVNAWNFDTDVVTADITLYAKWTAIPVFTVIFNVPGGGMNSISVTHGNKIPKPSDPIREHYTFEGWFKDENCTQAWDFANDVVTEDITLFSKWSLKNYTVTFNSRGGSNVPVATVAYGAKVAKPSPDPTRANYAFKGWFKDADGTTEWNFDNDVVSGNITLWAKWENVTGNESVEVRYSKVYPNPTDGVLTIEFAAPGTYIVSITDITGRVLLQETLTGQMERMDISSLPSGSYLLVVVDDNKQQTVMKVVKQ